MFVLESLEHILSMQQLKKNKAAFFLFCTSTIQLTEIIRFANHSKLVQISSFKQKCWHTSNPKSDTTLEVPSSQFCFLKGFFVINRVYNDKTQR